VPWVDFVKGQRKDDVMHKQLQHFTAVEDVVFIGRAHVDRLSESRPRVGHSSLRLPMWRSVWWRGRSCSCAPSV
jgi:hypothetical protein